MRSMDYCVYENTNELLDQIEELLDNDEYPENERDHGFVASVARKMEELSRRLEDEVPDEFVDEYDEDECDE